MTSRVNVGYISARDLMQRVDQKSNDFVVIDVRDLDRKYGHLPNSKHYPSCNFDESQCASIAADHAQQPKDIIFHCMLSQVRGPTCAGRFAEYLNSHHPTAKCRVLILKGGFQHWVATASQQPESSKYVLSFDRDAFENDM